MDNLKKGDYGRFHFFTQARGVKTGFDLMATVDDTDKKFVHLIDNDDIEYYVRRSDIDSFKESEKPELQELNK